MSKTTIIVNDDAESSGSHGFLKFLSVLLFAVFVAGLFVPRFFDLGTMKFLSGSIAAGEETVFTVIFEDLKSIITNKSALSEILSVISSHKMVWFLAGCAVILLISTLITLCCKKAAGGWFGIDCGILVIIALPLSYKYLLGANKYVDLFMVACALALVFLIIAAFARGRSKNILPVFCFLVLTALLLITCKYNFFPRENASLYVGASSLFSESLHWYLHLAKNLATGTTSSIYLYETVAYIMFAVLLACWILTVFQLGTVKKTTWFTIIRYLALLGVSVASFVLILTNESLGLKNDIGGYIKEYPYYIILIVAVLVLLILSLIARVTAKKKVSVEKKAKASSASGAYEPVEAPEYAAPVYNAPVYKAPVYSAPVYGAPVYGAPIYCAPVYDAPASEAKTETKTETKAAASASTDTKTEKTK